MALLNKIPLFVFILTLKYGFAFFPCEYSNDSNHEYRDAAGSPELPINIDLREKEPSKTEIEIDLSKKMDLSDIEDALKIIEAEYNGKNKIVVKEIGKSYEGKPVQALEINRSARSGGTVVITAAMVANHWKSVNFAFYMVIQLLEKNEALLKWLRIALVPLVNPDGYKKALKDDSYKLNTNDKSGNKCDGVNIGRNFDVGPAPKFEDCDTNQGTEYFSEPESRNIKSYFEELGDVKLFIYVMMTGSSVGIWYPYTYKAKNHTASKEMAENVGEAIADALGDRKKTVVSPAGSGAEAKGGLPYVWAVEKMKVAYSLVLTVPLDEEKVVDMEDFSACFEGIKLAILQLQLTDADVASAFIKECQESQKKGKTARSAVGLSAFEELSWVLVWIHMWKMLSYFSG